MIHSPKRLVSLERQPGAARVESQPPPSVTGGASRAWSNTGCDSNGIFLALLGNRHKFEYTCL